MKTFYVRLSRTIATAEPFDGPPLLSLITIAVQAHTSAAAQRVAFNDLAGDWDPLSVTTDSAAAPAAID